MLEAMVVIVIGFKDRNHFRLRRRGAAALLRQALAIGDVPPETSDPTPRPRLPRVRSIARMSGPWRNNRHRWRCDRRPCSDSWPTPESPQSDAPSRGVDVGEEYTLNDVIIDDVELQTQLRCIDRRAQMTERTDMHDRSREEGQMRHQLNCVGRQTDAVRVEGPPPQDFRRIRLFSTSKSG